MAKRYRRRRRRYSAYSGSYHSEFDYEGLGNLLYRLVGLPGVLVFAVALLVWAHIV